MKKFAWLLATVMLVGVVAAGCKPEETPPPGPDDNPPAATPVHHTQVVGDCIHSGTKEYWELDGTKYLDADCLQEATEESLVLAPLGHSLGGDDICETCGMSVWDGTVATAIADTSTGTADDPIEIAHASELALIAQNVNKAEEAETYAGKYIKLTVDLDLGNVKEQVDGPADPENPDAPVEKIEVAKSWTPIGGMDLPDSKISSYTKFAKKYPFSGTFDGDNHTIYRLTSRTNFDLGSEYRGRVGLFGLTEGATLKNIKLSDVDVYATIDTTDVAAGVNQRAAAALVSNSELELTIDNVKLLSGKVEGNGCVGGAVGLISAKSGGSTALVKISNVENHLEIFNHGEKTGGIVGASGAAYKLRTLIEDCVNYGYVHGNGVQDGGIIGAMLSEPAGGANCNGTYQIIRRCKNFGEIAGGGQAGGIAGVMNGRAFDCWTCEDIIFMHKELDDPDLGLIIGDADNVALLDIIAYGVDGNKYYGVIFGKIEQANGDNSNGMVDWPTCGICDKDGNPTALWTAYTTTAAYQMYGESIPDEEIGDIA